MHFLLLALALSTTPPVRLSASPPSRATLLLLDLQQVAELVDTQQQVRESLNSLASFEVRAESPQEQMFIRHIRLLAAQAPEWGRLDDPTAVLKLVAELLGEASLLWPDDEPLQLKLFDIRARLLRTAPASAKATFGKDLAFQLADLSRRFPASARVHLDRGSYGDRIGLSEVDRLRELKHCLSLDPALKSCRREYDALLTKYRVPRCAADSIARDAVLFEEDPAGARVVKDVNQESVHLAATPLLRAPDVVEVRAEPGTLDGDWPACSVRLSTSATVRFAAATSRLAAAWDRIHSPRHLALMIGKRLVFVAAAVDPILDGVFVFRTPYAPNPCASLCVGAMRVPALPEAAALQ